MPKGCNDYRIANEAVAKGTIGSHFSMNRMSWIKPSFLWMIGETDIDKTYVMPKSVVTYRKPRRISDERRSQLQKIMGNINKL